MRWKRKNGLLNFYYNGNKIVYLRWRLLLWNYWCHCCEGEFLKI